MNPELLGALSWVGRLPDGAVSVQAREGNLILKASEAMQQRFEELLSLRKDKSLNDAEEEEYRAICELDEALSWLNRLARSES